MEAGRGVHQCCAASVSGEMASYIRVRQINGHLDPIMWSPNFSPLFPNPQSHANYLLFNMRTWKESIEKSPYPQRALPIGPCRPWPAGQIQDCHLEARMFYLVLQSVHGGPNGFDTFIFQRCDINTGNHEGGAQFWPHLCTAFVQSLEHYLPPCTMLAASPGCSSFAWRPCPSSWSWCSTVRPTPSPLPPTECPWPRAQQKISSNGVGIGLWDQQPQFTLLRGAKSLSHNTFISIPAPQGANYAL